MESTTAGEPIVVRHALFLAEPAGSGTDEPKITTRIPYRPGESCYRWVLQVKPQIRPVTLTEVFELPSAARQWNTDPLEKTDVSSNKSSATTEFRESLTDGLVTHGWCVAVGDPPGHYKISVFENQKLLHRFEFDVYDETY